MYTCVSHACPVLLSGSSLLVVSETCRCNYQMHEAAVCSSLACVPVHMQESNTSKSNQAGNHRQQDYGDRPMDAYRITAAFSLTEDEHFAAVHFTLQQLQDGRVLLWLSQEHEVLGNHVIGLKVSRSDSDLVWVPEKVLGDCLNLLGPGGTPQQSLSVRSNLHPGRQGQDADHCSSHRRTQVLVFRAGQEC